MQITSVSEPIRKICFPYYFTVKVGSINYFFSVPIFSNIRIIFAEAQQATRSRDIEYCQFSTKGAYLY